MRATLVPHDAVPVGYVAYGTSLYDDSGNVIPASILPSPPSSGPYTTYYGENYLVLEETFESDVSLPIDTFKLYYESLMRMRQDSPSLYELLYMTNILGSGYIYDLELTLTSYYYTLYYSIDTDLEVPNKLEILNTWLAVIDKQFKNIVPVNRG
jgi:hypothetical protein